MPQWKEAEETGCNRGGFWGVVRGAEQEGHVLDVLSPC